MLSLIAFTQRNFVADFDLLPEKCNFRRKTAVQHNVHLELIGKHVVDFLLVLIELSSLCVTADALRAHID